MTTPYTILGLAASATTADAKKAYRKLVMKHHPDHGGDAERFKEIQLAWERIESGWRPPKPVFKQSMWPRQKTPFTASPHRSAAYKAAEPKIHPIEEKIVEAVLNDTVSGVHVARVTMADAFRGFVCEVVVDGKRHRVAIPPGVPHGLRFAVPISSGEDVIVMTRFLQNVYQFRNMETAPTEMVNGHEIHRTGELRLALPVESRNVVGWRSKTTNVSVQDFLGQNFTVTVPANHDPRIPIRVEGRGYVDWNSTLSQSLPKRADLSVSIQLTEDWRMNHLR